jgi:hypothetical protein
MNHTENTVSNTNSTIALVFVAAGTCVLIRGLETGCITSSFIRLFHSNGCTRYNRKANEAPENVELTKWTYGRRRERWQE